MPLESARPWLNLEVYLGIQPGPCFSRSGCHQVSSDHKAFFVRQGYPGPSVNSSPSRLQPGRSDNRGDNHFRGVNATQHLVSADACFRFQLSSSMLVADMDPVRAKLRDLFSQDVHLTVRRRPGQPQSLRVTANDIHAANSDGAGRAEHNDVEWCGHRKGRAARAGIRCTQKPENSGRLVAE